MPQVLVICTSWNLIVSLIIDSMRCLLKQRVHLFSTYVPRSGYGLADISSGITNAAASIG